MSKADDILKKYGITQVRNAETDKSVRDAVKKKLKEQESGSRSTSASTRTGSSRADSILERYGIEQVRNSETDESVRESVKKRLKELDEEEIAPVSERVKGNMTTDSDERKWYEGYFQKGVFEDGYQFGDISKAILGTGADALEDITTGIVGMGETALDALVQLGPVAYQSFVNSNGGIMSVKQQQMHDEVMKDMKEDTAAFVQKDLYDENKVAKQILANAYGAANNAYKTQNGGQLTQEDIIQQRENTKIAQQYIDNNMEAESVFGEETDSIAQSFGHRLAATALGTVGVPWWMTYGLTTAGSEAENAYKNGATYEEATGSAAISAGGELISEMLFGGSGLGETGVIKLDRLTRGISNRIAKNLADYGVDVAAEGVEEIFSEVVSKLGSALYREENLGEILASEEAFDDYIRSFISGSAMSGLMNSPKVVSHIADGTDYRGEFTQNEQKVIDKVYQDRLAELEQKGKVTTKQKADLYEKVSRDMERGYISTETIEEVLGGENYQKYKQAAEWENSLQTEYDTLSKEYDELYNMKYGEKSSKQSDREAALKGKLPELKKRLDNVKATSTLSQMKEQIGNDVFGLVKGDRLVESYNERARRGQAFEADLTQYDTKQQQTIQNAINSGTLNNTNRTHELVDFIAKISADKGVLFDFTNNEKIKGTRFAVEGKIVNGYKTDSGITLNVQSPKYLESTVGHEITHVLEGTEFYDALQETIFKYAESKGEYQTRLDALSKLYEGVEGADVKAELTADLVGDYIFTDTDFVNRLSTENRNVFQKVYDEIKYLCKVVTAGSKEARELEKVKKAFEDAYRANGKAEGDVKHSLSIKHTDGTVEELADARSLTNEQAVNYLYQAKSGALQRETYVLVRKDTPQVIIDTLEQVGEKVENRSLVMQVRKAQQAMASENPGNRAGKHGNNVRRHALSPEEVVDIVNKIDDPSMVIRQTERTDKHGNPLPDNVAVFVEYSNNGRESVAVIEFDSSIDPKSIGTEYGDTNYHTVVTVFEPDVERNGMPYDYAEELLSNPNNYELEIKRRQPEGSATGEKHPNTSNELPSFETKVAHEGENVNTKYGSVIYDLKGEDLARKKAIGTAKYSLSDSDGKQLTKEQQEYFKDSKMRDENGNLKVMYHGSENAGFHVFDARMSDDDTSFFFVDRNEVAQSYSGTSEVYEARTIRSAEDMNNFLAEIGYDHYKAVEKGGKFELLENNEHVATKDTAQEIYEEFCWYEGVGDGDANYKVYLNLKNPLEVDAQGRNWDNVSREFSPELYEQWKNEFTQEEKDALIDLAGWDDFSTFKSEVERAVRDAGKPTADEYTKSLSSAYWKNSDMSSLFSMAQDNFSDEVLKAEAVKQLTTRDYAQRAKEQGYDGVILKNIVDVGGYGNGDEGAATVAIAFESNQIKSVANENPTEDADIRYSLSEADNAYFDAVNRGDTSAAQMMVDEAAKNAGYTIKGYHGSPARFTVFDKNRMGKGTDQFGAGFYFGTTDEISKAYGGEQYEVYLDIKKPIKVYRTADGGDLYDVEITPAQAYKILKKHPMMYDAEESPLGDWYDTYWETGAKEWMVRDLANQYTSIGLLDGDIFRSYPNELHEAIRDVLGYDGVEVSFDNTDSKFYVAWFDNQMKSSDPVVRDDSGNVVPLSERFNHERNDIRFSLSNVGDTPYGRGTLGKDVALAPTAEDSSVVPEATVSETESVADMFPDDLAPIQYELEKLTAEEADIRSVMEAYASVGDIEAVNKLLPDHEAVKARINELQQQETERAESIADTDAPPEMDAPYYEASKPESAADPFADRDWYEVGKNRSTKAVMTENPEFKPFFQEEALNMLSDLADTQKAERWYNDNLHYESGGELGFGGQSRFTSQDIAQMLDEWGLSYKQIEEGLTAIAEDNDKVNNAPAKRIEFKLNERLMKGYKDFHTGKMVEPNQAYLDMLYERQVNARSQEAFDSFMETADQYAPMEDIAPVKPLAKATPDTQTAPIYESKDKNAVKGQTTMFEPPKPNPKVATVLTEESAITKEKPGIGKKLVSALVDKGMVFENLSLETGNHELQAKYNYALPSNTEARAQYFMENGEAGVKSLKSIQKEVKKTGKTEAFYDYLYHVHNIDRMTLEDRFDNTPNKTVFGETVTADVSRKKVAQYEARNPEFKAMAEDVYAYNRHLRNLLVSNGVISQETADLWQKMYPHYVPIRRVDSKGQNISVPLDSRKTGVNNPVKRATGGSSDILPLFETMAMRTEQTYRAIARNSFGIELKNTLGTTIDNQLDNMDVDELIDTIEAQDDKLLKPGTWNSNPTFTVFENGERVEFEITEDMYDALKPAGKLLGHRSEAIGKVADARRNLLTVWNPVFALYRNPIKDLQEVGINSQHPVKTYMNIPNAIFQMATGGKWATEYHQNGGKSNTYFDSKTNKFKAEDNIFKKTIGMPVRAIETAGEFIEEIPRLAEYIASRHDGRSVERSMLDSARVTTNFAAGGDFTKFLNSHGFTFLNASVQGASQHVRNFREAKANGLKGYVKVLAKYVVAGFPGILLNSLLWDDDEDYEELNDYVKQNYYVVAKTEDGKFVRIPKGRTATVMQECMEQMQNLVTGDDEVDFSTFHELFWNNMAPNNPLENNIIAPIGQALTNTAWYGGDLVPTRLQDLPAAEQFDESTDSISKWLGEATNTSPYKWNYLIDQYSGGLGDVFLPMLTPEAESGDNTLMGNILAPWKKELTTDSVLNNKNPGDFYDLKDELEILSNSKDATEEDAMRSMYMDSVSWDMSDLYQQKREIQNSDLPDDEKYEEVRKVQEQINELAKNAMSGYNDVHINGLYSEVGDRRYNQDADSGKWYEIHEKNADGSDNYYYQQEQKVTKALGISYGEYWNNREEYNYAYDKPEQYALSQAVGGYQLYRNYTSDLWDITADKDENGKSISGSRKEKVIDYINNMDADYGEKIILFKSEYPADDTYNMEIIDYLNSRDDISYKEMETILKYLGFEVDSKGNITWD